MLSDAKIRSLKAGPKPTMQADSGGLFLLSNPDGKKFWRLSHRFCGKAVMARVRAERDRFVGFVVEDVEGWPDAHKISGSVRFTAPDRLMLDDGTAIEAGRVVIATGSRAVWPAAWNTLGDRLIINDDVSDWDDPPGSFNGFLAIRRHSESDPEMDIRTL